MRANVARVCVCMNVVCYKCVAIQEPHRLKGSVGEPVLTLSRDYQYLKPAVDRWETFPQQRASCRSEHLIYRSGKTPVLPFTRAAGGVCCGDTIRSNKLAKKDNRLLSLSSHQDRKELKSQAF